MKCPVRFKGQTAAEAVGKRESRGLGGISKRGGDQLSRGDLAGPVPVGVEEVTGDVAAAPDPGNPLRLAGDVGETGPAST
jgi:hypothetical protein